MCIMRSTWIVIMLISLVLLFTHCATVGLTVDKTASMSEVQIGDEFNIQITVHGFDQKVTETIPFDVVLLIDMSASMAGEKFQASKDAAIAFITLAQNSGVTIPIGLATFGEDAPLVSALTNNYSGLINSINNLPDPDEPETRFEEAMRRANITLQPGTNAVRAAILLTDGCPFPDEPAQVNAISNIYIPEAQINSFRYYTVRIGNSPCTALLQMIASSTNGDFWPAPSSSALISIFGDLFEEMAHTIVSGQIELIEIVNIDNLEIIGPFEVDNALPMPDNSTLNTFYSTGNINIPMGELRSNRLHTIAFGVRAKSCLPPEAIEDFTTFHPNLSGSQVEYILGTVPSVIPLPDVEIKCWKDPDLDIKKDFDPESNIVTITLTSKYVETTDEDKIIRNISVLEYPSIHYQYIANTATPQPDAFIPDMGTDLLYWHIDELLPQEQRVFTFNVEQRAYVPRDGTPLRLDAVKSPEGVDAIVKYTPPGGNERIKRIPQKEVTAYLLENIPAGRPDLGIIQPFDNNELFTLGLGPYDPITDPLMPSDGPATAANWPTMVNLLSRWETISIWIDAFDGNGYVNNWSRNNGQNIQNHIHHVILDPLQPNIWKYIDGQGDLFKLSDDNRVYVEVYNSGEGASVAINDGIALYAKNYTNYSWDLIGTNNLPVINPSTEELIKFELSSNTLLDSHLEQFGQSSWNVWTAEFRFEIQISQNEKHTNNNVSTEKVFVVQ